MRPPSFPVSGRLRSGAYCFTLRRKATQVVHHPDASRVLFAYSWQVPE